MRQGKMAGFVRLDRYVACAFMVGTFGPADLCSQTNKCAGRHNHVPVVDKAMLIVGASDQSYPVRRRQSRV